MLTTTVAEAKVVGLLPWFALEIGGEVIASLLVTVTISVDIQCYTNKRVL